MKSKSDILAGIRNAVMTNCHTFIVFGGLEPEDAEYMTHKVFTTSVNLTEWKGGSEKPTAVGNRLERVRGRTVAEHHASHQMSARTRMHSQARGTSSTSTRSTGSALSDGSGDSYSLVMTPPLSLTGPNAPDASIIPTALSQNRGESNMRNAVEQFSESTGTSVSEVESYGQADTQSEGITRGMSVGESQAETWVTDYQDLPSAMWSKDEQLFRYKALLMGLEKRRCVVKVHHHPPVITRTRDTEPAFKSAFFRAQMLPLFIKAVVARSPYLRPVEEVDRLINEALQLSPSPPAPESDFAERDPVPIIGDTARFAREFVEKRKPRTKKPKPPKLEVIDGDKQE